MVELGPRRLSHGPDSLPSALGARFDGAAGDMADAPEQEQQHGRDQLFPGLRKAVLRARGPLGIPLPADNPSVLQSPQTIGKGVARHACGCDQ